MPARTFVSRAAANARTSLNNLVGAVRFKLTTSGTPCRVMKRAFQKIISPARAGRSSTHRNVGDVQRPDLVGPLDGDIPEQVRIDLVIRVAIAGRSLAVERIKLTRKLPEAVDKFTPEGRLPTEEEAARLI